MKKLQQQQTNVVVHNVKPPGQLQHPQYWYTPAVLPALDYWLLLNLKSAGFWSQENDQTSLQSKIWEWCLLRKVCSLRKKPLHPVLLQQSHQDEDQQAEHHQQTVREWKCVLNENHFTVAQFLMHNKYSVIHYVFRGRQQRTPDSFRTYLKMSHLILSNCHSIYSLIKMGRAKLQTLWRRVAVISSCYVGQKKIPDCWADHQLLHRKGVLTKSVALGIQSTLLLRL